MSRLFRELREIKGKPRLVGQRSARWLAALVAIGGALVVGSCLVANEFEFPVVDTLPGLVAISPEKFAQVGDISDPDCLDTGEDSWLLSATVEELDPERLVYVKVFINDNANGATSPERLNFPAGPERRTTYSVCLRHSLLSLPCNRVQLVAAHDVNDLRVAPVDGLNDPPYSVLEWTVLGQSRDNPDALPSDCAKLYEQDAGFVPLPDGAVVVPPADGGTLFPVDGLAPPPPHDGGP